MAGQWDQTVEHTHEQERIYGAYSLAVSQFCETTKLRANNPGMHCVVKLVSIQGGPLKVSR